MADLSRDELYNHAKEKDVPGRSRMSKAELVAALGG
ncbi:Rho termination factor N-terminal domain-containing protein [Deinococcus arboris]|nr:Rho termination factor N-terminal domain-containing protein [Deinococcus arboris]